MDADFLGPLLFPLIVGAFACAYLTQQVAEAKGYNPIDWAVKGFLFGPLGLLAAVGLPDVKSRKYLRLLAEHQGAIEPEPPQVPPHEG